MQNYRYIIYITLLFIVCYLHYITLFLFFDFFTSVFLYTVVNLYAYMNARFPDMIQKHCRPSCDPNPCKNGATCIEFWGSYKCVCKVSICNYLD